MRENKDTLVVCLSDMHSGSSVSVFPNELYSFNSERNHTPTAKQKRLYEHFIRCAAEAKILRKGKRMLIVHNGDATEGNHHHSTQVLTTIPEEQRKLHIYLMRRFLRYSGFDPARGDMLIYIKGTEIHTGETEEDIAKEMGAKYLKAHDFINLDVNGRKIWFTHQGANSQDGHTEGDALRNWLKRIYWNQVNRRRVVPDMVVMGHFHKPAYNAYIQRRDNGFHTLRGMILPSWQMKTRFAYARVPTTINEIGAAYMEITAEGDFRDPSFLLLESPNGVNVSV